MAKRCFRFSFYHNRNSSVRIYSYRFYGQSVEAFYVRATNEELDISELPIDANRGMGGEKGCGEGGREGKLWN